MRAGSHLRLGTLLGLALAAPASGCVDFLEPEELEPRRGELRVQLLVTDTAEARAEIEGRMVRPRGDDGREVQIPDSTLRLFGRTLAPRPAGAEDFLRYRADWRLSASEFDRDRISLEGPGIGAAGERVAIAFPLITRAGPDSVAPDGDGDLRLPLSSGSADAYGNVGSLSWTLVISEEGSEASLLILRGTGRPPDTLRVARNLLEGSASGGPVEALFWTRMHTRRSGGELPYDLQFDATVAVDWRVLLP